MGTSKRIYILITEKKLLSVGISVSDKKSNAFLRTTENETLSFIFVST